MNSIVYKQRSPGITNYFKSGTTVSYFSGQQRVSFHNMNKKDKLPVFKPGTLVEVTEQQRLLNNLFTDDIGIIIKFIPSERIYFVWWQKLGQQKAVYREYLVDIKKES